MSINLAIQTVLLENQKDDTLDNVANLNETHFSYWFLIIILLIAVVLTIFFLYRITKKNVISKPEKTNTNLPESQTPFIKQEKLTSELKNNKTAKTVKDPSFSQKSKTGEIKEQKTKTVPGNKTEAIHIKRNENVTTEKEEESKVKYIGYNPVNIFKQTEPFNYPIVLMPKPDNIIKFPRKGRSGRKGYKEEAFKDFINNYFNSDFQVFDDRFILVKNNSKPFEPDFTLIDEKNGRNIFIDIEIDEPYEGLNDISKRKPTHYQNSDNNRNNIFKNRGWIVIRFAEIQVHQEPHSCCKFIADVIKSINPMYEIPDRLLNYRQVKSIKQWTKEEAQKWSIERYREDYLGIDSFGLTSVVKELDLIEETELGDIIENKVEDDIFISSESQSNAPISKLEKIYTALNSRKFLSFTYENEKSIAKPIQLNGKELVAYCYVKNKIKNFNISHIQDVQAKNEYYTLRLSGPLIGLEKISNAVNVAIEYKKLIRMKYTRAAWTNYIVNSETGELVIYDRTEAEESIRTISKIQLAINDNTSEDLWFTPDENYITAYCHKREAERMFRFDRVGEIEILDL
jgi:hypothetical protein